MAYNNNYQNKSRNNNGQMNNTVAIKIDFQDSTYVDEAEQVIKEMQKTNFQVTNRPDGKLTMSQLRNLSALTSNIYDELQSNDVELIADKLAYLRVQFVYQSGRNDAVKKLIELAQILPILKKVQSEMDKTTIIRFCRYMEALVAYFKYYGGKD